MLGDTGCAQLGTGKATRSARTEKSCPGRQSTSQSGGRLGASPGQETVPRPQAERGGGKRAWSLAECLSEGGEGCDHAVSPGQEIAQTGASRSEGGGPRAGKGPVPFQPHSGLGFPAHLKEKEGQAFELWDKSSAGPDHHSRKTGRVTPPLFSAGE